MPATHTATATLHLPPEPWGRKMRRAREDVADLTLGQAAELASSYILTSASTISRLEQLDAPPPAVGRNKATRQSNATRPTSGGDPRHLGGVQHRPRTSHGLASGRARPAAHGNRTAPMGALRRTGADPRGAVLEVRFRTGATRSPGGGWGVGEGARRRDHGADHPIRVRTAPRIDGGARRVPAGSGDEAGRREAAGVRRVLGSCPATHRGVRRSGPVWGSADGAGNVGASAPHLDGDLPATSVSEPDPRSDDRPRLCGVVFQPANPKGGRQCDVRSWR